MEMMDVSQRRYVSDRYDGFRTQDPVPSDTDDSSNESSVYVTARSEVTEPTQLEDVQAILQVLDTESGAVFSKIIQGSGDEIPASQLRPEVLSCHANNVLCQVTPTGHNAEDRHLNSGALMPPLPSLMLTIPTPQLPPSPFFVPRSPITISKFVMASSSPASPFLSAGPVPSIPICEDCCLINSESGQHCRSCDKQWLACKVWYQANDGGRRQQLTEPYIKPAESTLANRALVDLINVPSGPANFYGLGIRTSPGAAVSKSRFRKLAPLLALITMDSSTSVGRNEELLATRARPQPILGTRLPLVATFVSDLWAKTVNTLTECIDRLDLAGFLDVLLRSLRPPVSTSRSSLYITTQDGLMGDPRLREHRISRPLGITSASRFLEHLA
ncbi:uncharacterized protein FIBRA_00917 [Fibroporia radiculosa]|uniref:Uncharacterized protein n=1 Tax=Fibroporia radiculosa TaxID=599839 RepID=J4GIY0_9APHY|nr:uncharacterized protein FIBRA_00917 [Fibroporia radiculosa]CCL98910.1 predicted protein [Fibroporia radiculosa]